MEKAICVTKTCNFFDSLRSNSIVINPLSWTNRQFASGTTESQQKPLREVKLTVERFETNQFAEGHQSDSVGWANLGSRVSGAVVMRVGDRNVALWIDFLVFALSIRTPPRFILFGPHLSIWSPKSQRECLGGCRGKGDQEHHIRRTNCFLRGFHCRWLLCGGCAQFSSNPSFHREKWILHHYTCRKKKKDELGSWNTLVTYHNEIMLSQYQPPISKNYI